MQIFPIFLNEKKKHAEEICIEKLYIGVKKCLFSYFSSSFKVFLDWVFFSSFFPLLYTIFLFGINNEKRNTLFFRMMTQGTYIFFLSSQTCLQSLHCTVLCGIFFYSFRCHLLLVCVIRIFFLGYTLLILSMLLSLWWHLLSEAFNKDKLLNKKVTWSAKAHTKETKLRARMREEKWTKHRWVERAEKRTGIRWKWASD